MSKILTSKVLASKILAGTLAAAAFAAFAGAAHADKVCQWTGSDWACGDGNTFPDHYPAATGPNLVLTPVPTPNTAPGQPLPTPNGPRPY